MSEQAAAPCLTRITTRYVPLEDRVRIAGELDEGGTVAVWLTLRLLQRLVPRLVRRLEPSPAGEPHHEVFQEIAQARAVAAQTPVASVEVPASGAAWLAQNVILGRSGDRLLLTFAADGGRRAALALPPPELRQWLGIVCRAYADAGWPMDAWPDWIVGGILPGAMPPRASFH